MTEIPHKPQLNMEDIASTERSLNDDHLLSLTLGSLIMRNTLDRLVQTEAERTVGLVHGTRTYEYDEVEGMLMQRYTPPVPGWHLRHFDEQNVIHQLMHEQHLQLMQMIDLKAQLSSGEFD